MGPRWYSLPASPALIGSRQPFSCSLRAPYSDAVHEDLPGSCGGVRCGVPAPGLRRLYYYGDDGGSVGQRHQQQQLDAHARGRGAPCLSCPSAAADSRRAGGEFHSYCSCRDSDFWTAWIDGANWSAGAVRSGAQRRCGYMIDAVPARTRSRSRRPSQSKRSLDRRIHCTKLIQGAAARLASLHISSVLLDISGIELV